MSVRVVIQYLVTGTDDPEAVADALRRSWDELGGELWGAIRDGNHPGMMNLDTAVESIETSRPPIEVAKP